MMPSTCIEPEGSSLPYLYVLYNRLPADEPSGSKREEDMKLKY